MVDPTPDDAPTVTGGPTSRISGPGEVLGERYRIQARLGRGGMGEVWHAYDLKLQVDVALKALLPGLLQVEKRRELLRREVRSAREVVSPNVCRIYDLVEADGQELVSMEYIDGATLNERLKSRGPLDVEEASELAAQFLAGLEAIHQAGLVHRDIKPDNLMITRSGRVVVMDFGIAKPVADQGGTIAGTPAYMAPEQMRGETPDARSDVYSAGVLLAEMLAAGDGFHDGNKEAFFRAIHKEPPDLPASPWQPVLLRAVAQDPAARPPSARSLARSLEEVTLRVSGVEGRRPYPGLSCFTAEDAEYFFGREVEVEALWKKLGRPHLLGLIGPSGAGKSSFLRAGLLPAMPEGWRHVLCAPGARPFTSLGQALAPELAEDPEALRDLLRFDETDVAVATVARWRKHSTNALIVLDQFEELFTLCAPEVQERFAELLGRLALEADVHVLLSMRDDFLMFCSRLGPLAPIFAQLTPLDPPTGDSLRRALVQPALKCGYRFEDEALVDEMLSGVAGERGALPMLAFAAAQLWERRDQEKGLLTRAGYEEIGGVEGALARHAEATLERIGPERGPLVREIFRNLVTAQGTRAAREREEILSVFEDRDAAAAVLRELVDARLLTSYQTPGETEEDAGNDRLEIIHESLLAQWPRLVRWQTQDADGAQLRDQLRQAAQLWEERARSDDLLWTGSAYGEYALWRERYPGGLSDSEEAFASAMASRASRQRRRRRTAIVTGFVVLVAILSVVGSLWRASVRSELEARAGELLGLAKEAAEEDPTAALAYATASLERSDDPWTRRFTLKLLQREPVGFVLDDHELLHMEFSSDGEWLAGTGRQGVHRIWGSDGSMTAPAHENTDLRSEFAGGSRHVTWNATSFQAWSPPDWKEEALRQLPEGVYAAGLSEGMLLSMTQGKESLVQRWSLDGGPPEALGLWKEEISNWKLDSTRTWVTYADGEKRQILSLKHLGSEVSHRISDRENLASTDIDADGEWLAYADGRDLLLLPLERLSSGVPRLVGRMAAEIQRVRFLPDGSQVASMDVERNLMLWSIDGGGNAPLRSFPVKASRTNGPVSTRPVRG